MKAPHSSSADYAHGRAATVIAEQAAEWLVRRNDGFSNSEEREFQEWISADSANQRAFISAETTWAALNQPRETGQAALLDYELAAKQTARKRRRLSYVFATAGVAAAAVIALGVFLPVARVTEQSPVTIAMRPDRQTLADGSIVELKAGAEIALSFSPDARRVRLLHGEALFNVAKEATRPFFVIAGHVEVRAVGTAFAVRHDMKEVAVLVTEGRVAVERHNLGASSIATTPEPKPTYLGAGDRLVVPADLPATAAVAVTTMTAQQVASNLAWRGQRVEFTGTTVGEALTMFNHQNRLQLSVADPAIARLQITGIFWADDPEGFVRLLENGMNVRGDRTNRGIELRSR
ncbi:MAG: FecR domain-containing protein [Opitutaceae bacterium]|nr:FecR domain-containing protein [Opitutaceae bacterium]